MRRITGDGRPFSLRLPGGRLVECTPDPDGFRVGRRRVGVPTLRRACHFVLAKRRTRLAELTGVVESSSVVAALLCHLFPDLITVAPGKARQLYLAVRAQTHVACRERTYRIELRASESGQLSFDMSMVPGETAPPTPDPAAGPDILRKAVLYHVMDGGSNLDGWDLSNRPIPSLISLAAYLDKKNGMQTSEASQVIAAKCSPLMLDSGRLSWMKKGMADWARRDLTPLLLSVGHRIGADVIVAGDVPMEP